MNGKQELVISTKSHLVVLNGMGQGKNPISFMLGT
jgi:hypothetical protein